MLPTKSQMVHVADTLAPLWVYDARVVTRLVEEGVGWERLYT